jgi:hypothetical protein
MFLLPENARDRETKDKTNGCGSGRLSSYENCGYGREKEQGKREEYAKNLR